MIAPANRVRPVNAVDISAEGDYVLYWMTAFRRTKANFALEHAIGRARELRKPLVVLEALRVDYPWACDRFHAFVLDGMAANARAFAGSSVAYYPYVEPAPGAAKGLLRAFAGRAALIVADDYPAFFLPRALAAASALSARIEAVDSNGLLPMRLTDRVFSTAHSFRRFLQKELPNHIDAFPAQEPLLGADLPAPPVPDLIQQRWPAAKLACLEKSAPAVAELLIDHRVPPCATGGPSAAANALDDFVANRLVRYAEERNHPDLDATSNLSQYLHFGHVSAHEVFRRIAASESWSPDRLAARADGRRTGWWGMSESAGAFLDQLITWRELGFNMAAHRDGYESYESLPDWALRTLAAHEHDAREHLYSFSQLEQARTHDELWNAAQTQLLREGRIHNYLRMLWGKKILEWTPSPGEALQTMVELNNKYALDGRDPNSYSGILWVLGRYDRAWGPERPVFGKVRYMSSANTARKVRVRRYLERYGPGSDA